MSQAALNCKIDGHNIAELAAMEVGELVHVVNSIKDATSAPVVKAVSFGQNAVVLYAVVPVRNVTPGLTVTADWTFNGSALPGVASAAEFRYTPAFPVPAASSSKCQSPAKPRLPKTAGPSEREPAAALPQCIRKYWLES